MVEVVLLQFNLIDNQYQQKSQVLHAFTPNNNLRPICEMFNQQSSVYNTGEFVEIIITFTNQNGKLTEIEDKVNLTLLINK